MTVVWVGALYIGDRFRVAETRQGVHVAVRVVAFEVSVLQNKNTVGIEYALYDAHDRIF